VAQIPVQTPAGSQAQVDAHNVAADPHPGLTTTVGPHAGTHASGSTDPVTPGSIGAATAADVAGAVSAHSAAGDPHAGYATDVEVALKANTSSLATVATSGLYTDLSGTVPTSALPALAINDTFPVTSQAAMLALTAQRGDVAIRSDLGKSFILSTDSPSTLANWLELSSTGQVTSVNGQQGVILLAKADVGLGNVDNTTDAGKPISTLQQAALDARQPLDPDLTAFAALVPPDDSLPQRKAGEWIGRTPAQVKIDLALSYADLSGTVPQSAIPAIAITEYLGAVASQPAMLALVGQRGDWCTRTDLGTDWQLIADSPAALVSWREMTYPASPVQSVSGRTGAVVLTKADVGLGSADNTSDAGKPVSTAQQTALALKMPLATPSWPHALVVGEDIFSRERADSNSVGTNSQAVRLTYFTARKSQTSTQVRMLTGGTAAAATPTLCRIGLYTADELGDGTLVASTLNDTSLFAAANTAYTRDWITPYLMVVGQRYALAFLVVTTLTTPTFIGATGATSVDSEHAMAPRLTGRLNSQMDLPASFVTTAFVVNFSRFYGVIL